jgi:DNA repair exonuclease SbcCD nuclease subunit
MKIALLGDTHFGARNDSQVFHRHFAKFYSEVFFPYLKQHDISRVIQLGDLFDRRKYINFVTLDYCRKYFFDKLIENGIIMDALVGNHDTPYKNTIEVNAPRLLLQEYESVVRIHDNPTEIQIGIEQMLIIPWICQGNIEETMALVEQSNARWCAGHFEFAGFRMYKGGSGHDGIDRKMFDKFEKVFSGHYHHRQEEDNILYTGVPYEMTWSDYDDMKGFYVLDTITGELEFVPNPNIFFHKFEWPNTQELNFGSFADKAIKVVVNERSDAYTFDVFLSKFEGVATYSFQVVDNTSAFAADDDEAIDGVEDTPTILKSEVSKMKLSKEDKGLLTELLLRIHQRALELE